MNRNLVQFLGLTWCNRDVIGNVQCDNLSGRIQTQDGTSELCLISITTVGCADWRYPVSARAWCREMKVIQAFSWMLFVLFAFAFMILLSLVSRAQAFGRFDIWREPIRGQLLAFTFKGFAPGFDSNPNRAALVRRSPWILQHYCQWNASTLSRHGTVPWQCISTSATWFGSCDSTWCQWATAYRYPSAYCLNRLIGTCHEQQTLNQTASFTPIRILFLLSSGWNPLY